MYGAGARYAEEAVSDSEFSLSPSPNPGNACFCGQPITNDGVYCSVVCARSDAINSLCYKSNQPPARALYIPDAGNQLPSFGSALSSLPRDSSAGSLDSCTGQDEEWQASHYRRLARSDARRQERREERRRRRAEGSMGDSIGNNNRSTNMSSSSSMSRVPDLVGGHGGGHSRNGSSASSVSSLASSAFSLSRNSSTASNASRRAFGGGVNVDSVIEEAEDEQEWLRSEATKPYAPSSMRKHGHQKSGEGRSMSSRRRKQTPDALPFGMGQDMRDVLNEILHLEQSYLTPEQEVDISTADDLPPPRLFTSSFGPPRTPSPASCKKRVLPSRAPDAPFRGHRASLSQSALAPHSPAMPARPTSLVGMHQSSLSESHTALYLATASPSTSTRRSASPTLETRRSLTFDANSAGPSINLDFASPPPLARPGSLTMPPRGFESSPLLTPVNRRFTHTRTPQAIHPSMDGWRFPSPFHAHATPTKPTHLREPETPEPIGRDHSGGAGKGIQPALLWPPAGQNLQPALFAEDADVNMGSPGGERVRSREW
ncbi:hypothetical protein L202_02252 [Cryptococcus amylolentus CBS 6039]|uniref:Uncharacterized protein n=1 Tax=Cryptococcus amylolentus CBS 6039 TaxID=1295533 RepID=A0A1E3I1P5_9TREE|nr:hypothetical protein L202_02252 [Cryptococcus amylolentus CBS 6039]ODN81906.1 hypothetical protein L202_02252 [Cryptococcus amylolentus CBS 6039]